MIVAFLAPSIPAGTAYGATAQTVTLATATRLGCAPITTGLYLGSFGSPVENVQHFLVGQGLLATSSVTGYFGPLTRGAVTAFQLSQGLITNPLQLGAGTVGPKTAAAMQALCPVAPIATPPSGFITATAKEVYRKDTRGETRVKYTFTKTPALEIARWRLTLLCAEDSITTNRRDLRGCGEYTEISAGRSVRKTYTISYFNERRATQQVGMRVDALDSTGAILETTEAGVQVYPVVVEE